MRKKCVYIILSFFVFLLFIQTCDNQNPVKSKTTTSTITDIDGIVYQTVKIGNQWWMAENLKVTQFRNGDAIPKHTGGEDWLDLTTSHYCVFANNDSNTAVFGNLYNWFVVHDRRQVAPAGWHVPSDAEWKELEQFLGMSESEANMGLWRGTDEGGQLKSASDVFWLTPNKSAVDAFEFNAIGSGYRCGGFHSLGETAAYWTRSEKSASTAWGRCLTHYESRILRSEIDKTFAYSIRCVKD